jgi:hypothetical protein
MRKDILMVAAVAGALGSGCLVQIEHVRDARPHFEAARREAARLQGRRGPAHELNVLVYDAREEKLVRVSVPMWLARKIESHVDWDKDVDLDCRNDDKERVRRSLRRHVNLKEIEKAGLGLLVEVDEDDGEQVLVWLR